MGEKSLQGIVNEFRKGMYSGNPVRVVYDVDLKRFVKDGNIIDIELDELTNNYVNRLHGSAETDSSQLLDN
mgnify:CR=1 FL=1